MESTEIFKGKAVTVNHAGGAERAVVIGRSHAGPVLVDVRFADGTESAWPLESLSPAAPAGMAFCDAGHPAHHIGSDCGPCVDAWIAGL